MDEVARFCYLGCISAGDRTSDGVSSRIQKDRLGFTNLRHLCHSVINQRAGIRSCCEVGIFIGLQNATAESRHAKSFGVWTLLLSYD